MSVAVLSSDDNAITKRRGRGWEGGGIKARQETGSAPTRTLLAPCKGCGSALLLSCNFCSKQRPACETHHCPVTIHVMYFLLVLITLTHDNSASFHEFCDSKRLGKKFAWGQCLPVSRSRDHEQCVSTIIEQYNNLPMNMHTYLRTFHLLWVQSLKVCGTQSSSKHQKVQC